MNLKSYFEDHRGTGVLSTADSEGRVNAAIYARPYILEDGTIAFIMRDRLSHHNLTSNLHASYLFREEGSGYKGVRLHLTKVHEEQGTPRVQEMCRRCKIKDDPEAVRFLTVFQIDKEMPLIGPEDAGE